MSSEAALLQLPPVHFIAAGNQTEQIYSPPASPVRGSMTRVATFPLSGDPDSVFPKVSKLKQSPATSDSNLFRITRSDVSESSQDFQVKLTQLIASLRGVSASPVFAVIDEVTVRSRSHSVKIGRKVKKHVRFADDHGAELVQIRINQESTDVPPILTSETVIKLLNREFPPEPVPVAKPTWCLDFPQPASEYIRFRKRLQQDNVVLEHVVVQPCQKAGDGKRKCRLVGTIRVLNVAFEKKVFLRLTENNWISYSDHPAYYSGSSHMEPFDTFTFDTEIPVNDDFHPRLAFCVGYQAGGVTYWDNNELNNYAILSKRVKELWTVQSEESFYGPPEKPVRSWHGPSRTAVQISTACPPTRLSTSVYY